MSVFLNDQSATALALTLPRVGAWHADVTLLPSSEIPNGQVTLSVFDVIYVGTVLRSGSTKGLPFARIIGGGGGLGTVLPAKAYRGSNVRLPLSEILSGAGETLASSSDSATLSQRLAFWIRMEGKAGESLVYLLSTAGIPCWRVLPDGTVWVGTESWPVSKLEDFQVLSEDPHLGRYEVYAREPAVFPGEVWNSRKVSVVEHRFTSRKLTTSLWVENEDA
jgi:hypothetical protein